MTAIRYSLQEALRSIRRSGRSAAMSIGTISIAFLTLGGFLLIAANLEHVVEPWASAAEMSVYLRDGVDQTVRQELMTELSAHRAVSAVEHVSKEDALARFKSDFPELGDIAASGANPFPSSIEVRLRTDSESAGAADAMAGGLAERAGVADVRYDSQWIGRLTAIVRSIRLAGLGIAAILVLGAAFTVAAVVRLSLAARREELDIMELVGAPFAYIRGPAIAEGTLLGGVGAALSLVLVWAMFVGLRGPLSEAVVGLADGGALRFLSLHDEVTIVITGLVVGGLAGVAASRVVR